MPEAGYYEQKILDFGQTMRKKLTGCELFACRSRKNLSALS